MKKGIFVFEATGKTAAYFVVEFDDGTAELFNDWDTAVQAGGFDLTGDTE